MIKLVKNVLKRVPLLEGVARRFHHSVLGHDRGQNAFPGSKAYWERRYADGSNSGAGSYNYLAEFKADVINSFVASHQIHRVIEFGCGDGNQLRLARYPSYLGLDVSSTAITQCKALFQEDPRKSFKLLADFSHEKADLVLSLDVIYHLVEDFAFEDYMERLFSSSSKFVIIYSSNFESTQLQTSEHVRHRNFGAWIAANEPQWNLIQQVPNKYPYQPASQEGSLADFFIYELRNSR